MPIKRAKRKPRVVVLTSDDTPGTILRAIRERAHQFVHKPIEPLALLSLVRETLKAGPQQPIEVVSARGPAELPCALVRGHAPFCWAAGVSAAVECAVTLEEVARMALLTLELDPDAPPLADPVRSKHFERKHGPGAYYGQA